MMNHKELRELIRNQTSSDSTTVQILNGIGIDVTREGFVKVRPGERTPSCKINKDGHREIGAKVDRINAQQIRNRK